MEGNKSRVTTGTQVSANKKKKEKGTNDNTPILRLKPREEGESERMQEEQPQKQKKPATKRVVWAEETVDNEHMNKRKSNSKTM